jgi:uncharacterized membrane protein YcaP (DUF421 family)
MAQNRRVRVKNAMLFDNLSGLARVVAMSVLAYGSLVLILRFAGKRSLAKLNAFDFVVTVALGSTLATVLLTSQVAFLEGLLAFAMLAALQWVVSRLSVASPFFRDLVRSRPRLLVEEGRLCRKAMAEERVTQEEIEAAIRAGGIGHIEQVGAVVLETDGNMSVIRAGDRPLDLLGSVRR